MAKNVLIVDDSNTMRKIITRSLRQAGLTFDAILEAGDGQEALNILNKDQVALVLCDVNMPTMDGLEFLKNKGSDAAIKDIPVVMITTEGGTEDIVQQVRQLGASATIKKPFTADQINEVISPLV
jgi:two-component system chemotaxis response regulator CheY